MSDDLKERLRAGCPSGCGSMTTCVCATMADALARIEELEQENAKLRDGVDQDSRFILAYQQICRDHGIDASFKTVLDNIPEDVPSPPKSQLNQ